jgi:hypothetical protein
MEPTKTLALTKEECTLLLRAVVSKRTDLSHYLESPNANQDGCDIVTGERYEHNIEIYDGIIKSLEELERSF